MNSVHKLMNIVEVNMLPSTQDKIKSALKHHINNTDLSQLIEVENWLQFMRRNAVTLHFYSHDVLCEQRKQKTGKY